jgi:hypothetical protein
MGGIFQSTRHAAAARFLGPCALVGLRRAVVRARVPRHRDRFRRHGRQRASSKLQQREFCGRGRRDAANDRFKLRHPGGSQFWRTRRCFGRPQACAISQASHRGRLEDWIRQSAGSPAHTAREEALSGLRDCDQSLSFGSGGAAAATAHHAASGGTLGETPRRGLRLEVR